ncbi:VOC family protein [Lentiprolixibacter aurantiacus]|uniref:VOC family protein n=1 Tax=Lentiprolixibacter aurantiacus TaxID=2993939 RepID=A0AAE3SNH1_9FLAO|nr:VOC family protein [Lentiprolixibacter aurantiacus]MCX2719520.1 VOC family protein [Lentiprolixibacter aurantiacus]
MIGSRIKGLGEIVLRVKDMRLMRDFYVNTLGFAPMRTDEHYTFLKLAEGYRGHTQVLALFDAANSNAFGETLEPVANRASPLHHFALEIDSENFIEIVNFLEYSNIEYVTETFTWVKWKSIFIKDPEHNILELVCYDPEI